MDLGGTRTTRGAIVTISLLIALTGCSKSSNETEVESVSTTEAIVETTTSTTVTRVACTAPNLQAAADQTHPGASLDDVACSSAAAMATITGGGSPADPGVAFFRNGDDGQWVIVSVATIDEAEANQPDGMPIAVVNSWKSKFEHRTSTPAPTEAPPANEPPPVPECPDDVAPQFCDLFRDEAPEPPPYS